MKKLALFMVVSCITIGFASCTKSVNSNTVNDSDSVVVDSIDTVDSVCDSIVDTIIVE